MELAVLESLCRSKKHAGIISYPARLSKGVGLHYTAFRGDRRMNPAQQAAFCKLSLRKNLKPRSNVESRVRQNLVSNVKASRTKDAAILHDVLPALYALHPEKFQSVDKRLAADHKGHVFEAPEGRPVHVVTDMEQGLLFHSLSNAVRKCFEPICR